MSVTLTDISQALGLSVSTVSKALNGYRDVAPETRDRVLSMAQAMGYHPNTAARNLRRQRTDKIGLLLNTPIMDINDYLVEVMAGSALAAEQLGYNLVLYTNATDRSEALLRLCRTREVDGVLLIWTHVPDTAIDLLQSEGVPAVVFGRRVDHPTASYVAPDNYAGMRALMDHLLGLGHRRIGFFGRPALRTTHEDRLAAYQDALAQAGIPFDPDLVVTTRLEPNSGYLAMQRLLDLPEPPSAVFAFHDGLALQAIRAAAERGLRIPQDVAVAGFDGWRSGLFANPPMTTVQLPLREMGQRAVSILLERIEHPDLPPVREIFPVELVVRASTAGDV
ncbi:MAG: LacI family transcriptional regulator [Caldilineae bacterium]|nr:MAG: LacI family transcriptional regulator [Caldilineae bacterium]